ncbi:putative mitochondrial protein [Tanacetum coccineum]
MRVFRTIVVEEYEDVFAIPTELPPKRGHDHKIPLLEGAQLVNIRPYRHPPTQKYAIKGMVAEVLESLEDREMQLRIVLTMMRQHKLYAKKSKCMFRTNKVEYLGHVIFAIGVATDPDKKNRFSWSIASQFAFEQLKHAMVNALVLRLPDFLKEFTLEIDASHVRLGGFLLQEGHPIAFLNKTLSAKHLLRIQGSKTQDVTRRIHN